MDIRDSVLAAIGNTPLIKLRRASEETGCMILGKAEFMNPGHSVKDRAALGIVTDAIDKGQLRPGGLIVEGTAGNTGIGLTVVGNALGMKTVIVIPETQSQEKKDTLRSLGATLVEVPAAPYRSDNNYVKVAARMAERLAREHPQGAIFANQFDNVANRDVHVRTTGPDVAIAIADVPGAALYSYYTTGELKAEGSSITEGIGQGRITANLEGLSVDEAFFIEDQESLVATLGLVHDEGLNVGLSTGVNVAGAIRLARRLGPGKTIVTVLCDPATRYQSRLFNPEFLRSKGLTPPNWLEQPESLEPDLL